MNARTGLGPLLVAGAFALLGACGHSPTSPSRTPAQPVTSTTTGRAVNVLTGDALAAVGLRLEDGTTATSGADGAFRITAATSGTHAVTLTSPDTVERQTSIRVPGPEASLSLVPASFDLATYDEMCRAGGSLRRWSAAPSLAIVDAVVRFTSLSDMAYAALDARLTAQERESIAADLGSALPQVTGGSFGGFAAVRTESVAPGSQVSVSAPEGTILVVRVDGLTKGTGYWGYGRWASRASTVVAGTVMLDASFDTSSSQWVRSLRVHEMGHALGYDHVWRRLSFMNNSATQDPNAFDRDATRLAFQRPPGNQAPDKDPSGYSANAAARLVWGPFTP